MVGDRHSMAKTTVLLTFVATILLAGCTGAPATPTNLFASPQATPSAISNSVSSHQPTPPHPIPTSLITPMPSVTMTQGPTPSPSTVPVSAVKQQCLTVQAAPTTGDALKGTLVFEKAPDGIYLFDVRTQKVNLLPSTPQSSLWNNEAAISPDHKWLAYIETFYDQAGHYKNHQLHLVTSDGQR